VYRFVSQAVIYCLVSYILVFTYFFNQRSWSRSRTFMLCRQHTIT